MTLHLIDHNADAPNVVVRSAEKEELYQSTE